MAARSARADAVLDLDPLRAGEQHLPRGINGPGGVLEIQRARLIDAMARVATERGAGNVSVAQVVAQAGVSRRTFYEIFRDSEECFLATIDDACERAAQSVKEVVVAGQPWRDRVRAGLTALLRFAEEEPQLARLLVVEALAAGHGALAWRQDALARLIAAVDRVRDEAHVAKGIPTLSAESVVGAAVSVVHSRLLEAGPQPLTELVNPLMCMIVLPYLGSTAARGELSRPLPEARHAKRTVKGESPLKTLEMRVTYRTVLTVVALGSHPGASNREIGEASGIVDQGQVSKLLRRLERLGLVENANDEPAGGAPNSWTLTPRGWEAHEALAAQRR